MKAKRTMKKYFAFQVAFLFTVLGFIQIPADAQPPNRPRTGGQGAGMRGPGSNTNTRQVPPLLRVFDTDGDNELSAKEIDRAAEVLRKLDRNRNGRLSADELRPSGSGRGGGRSRGPGQQRQPRGSSQQPQSRGPGQQRQSQGGRRANGRGGNPAQGDTEFASQLLLLDENNDKMISRDELPDHMQAAFLIADDDKSGSLDQAEQLKLAAEFRRNRLRPGDDNLEMKNPPAKQGRRPKRNSR